MDVTITGDTIALGFLDALHAATIALGFLDALPAAIRGVTRADRLQNIKIRKDTFTPESITDVIRHQRFEEGGLGILAICKEIPLLGKYTKKISKDSGREEDH